MCGRYQRRADKQRIAEAFDSAISMGFLWMYHPTINAAPGSMQPSLCGMNNLVCAHSR